MFEAQETGFGIILGLCSVTRDTKSPVSCVKILNYNKCNISLLRANNFVSTTYQLLIGQVGKTAVCHAVVPGSLLLYFIFSLVFTVLVVHFHNSKWNVGSGTPHCGLMLTVALL